MKSPHFPPHCEKAFPKKAMPCLAQQVSTSQSFTGVIQDLGLVTFTFYDLLKCLTMPQGGFGPSPRHAYGPKNWAPLSRTTSFPPLLNPCPHGF